MIENLPNHIAIVPDGNRRWATMKQLSVMEGHQAGARRMHDVIAQLIEHKIKHLTLWGFSSDNWKRSPGEVQAIFELLRLWIANDLVWLHENSVRLRHIGRFNELPTPLKEAIAGAIETTRNNKGMTLNLAFNYSGRVELVDAVRRIIEAHVRAYEVDDELINRYLYTDDSPDVDLVIRTAGEFRLSNFMLWQTAYAEYYFTPVFWPDFDAIELGKALEAYQQRDRRFGGG